MILCRNARRQTTYKNPQWVFVDPGYHTLEAKYPCPQLEVGMEGNGFAELRRKETEDTKFDTTELYLNLIQVHCLYRVYTRSEIREGKKN